MDINIYNLHFVIALLGSTLSARYVCRRGFNGVDLSGTVVLDYGTSRHAVSGSETIALCTGSKETDAPSFGLLQGDNGWLRIDGPVSMIHAITLCLRGQQPQQIPVPSVTHRLAPEFAAIANLIHREDYDTMNQLLDHSLAVMQLVDQIAGKTQKNINTFLHA